MINMPTPLLLKTLSDTTVLQQVLFQEVINCILDVVLFYFVLILGEFIKVSSDKNLLLCIYNCQLKHHT